MYQFIPDFIPIDIICYVGFVTLVILTFLDSKQLASLIRQEFFNIFGIFSPEFVYFFTFISMFSLLDIFKCIYEMKSFTTIALSTLGSLDKKNVR